jgi:phosphoribosylformylglycinamidine synthase
MAFHSPGDLIFVLGETRDELSGSEWAHATHGHLGGLPPEVDLGAEMRLAGLIGQAARGGLVNSAHDLSDGGLAQALVEACLRLGHGAEITLAEGMSAFTQLFSESSGRALVSVRRGQEAAFAALATERGVACTPLGVVRPRGAALTVVDQFDIALRELWEAHSATLPSLFGAGEVVQVVEEPRAPEPPAAPQEPAATAAPATPVTTAPPAATAPPAEAVLIEAAPIETTPAEPAPPTEATPPDSAPAESEAMTAEPVPPTPAPAPARAPAPAPVAPAPAPPVAPAAPKAAADPLAALAPTTPRRVPTPVPPRPQTGGAQKAGPPQTPIGESAPLPPAPAPALPAAAPAPPTPPAAAPRPPEVPATAGPVLTPEPAPAPPPLPSRLATPREPLPDDPAAPDAPPAE